MSIIISLNKNKKPIELNPKILIKGQKKSKKVKNFIVVVIEIYFRLLVDIKKEFNGLLKTLIKVENSNNTNRT